MIPAPVDVKSLRGYMASVRETGASWSKIDFFPNSDFNINLVLLVWHFTVKMIIFLSNYIVFSLNNELF